MKKIFMTSFLFTLIWLTTVALVLANPNRGTTQQQKKQSGRLPQIGLSIEQTEKIRELRLAHETAISPLRIQEHQIKAELNIFWLQLSPDLEKIKSAQKKIHDLRFEILEEETNFRIAMREILTQDQLSKFLALGGDRPHGQNKSGHRPHQPQQQMLY